MAVFDYTAVDYAGRKVNSQVEAKDRNSAISKLRKTRLVIISIRESNSKEIAPLKKRHKVKLEDLVLFTRQLAALVKAGVSLVKGLNILLTQVENLSLRDIISTVITKIESGSSLSDALAMYPDVFSHLFINMIKAGEFSGALDDILERLALYQESVTKFNRKVKSAFTYPIIVFSVAMLITAVIFLKVIPGFKDMFATLNVTLPTPTLIVIKISELFRSYFFVVVGVLVASVFIMKRLVKIAQVQMQLDKIKLNFPVFGKIVRKVIVARFSRTLYTLIKSGVSILSALEISSKTSGNKVVESILGEVMVKVSKGEKIAASLSESNVFSFLVINLIAVGEETGDLASMLDKIAQFYEEEVDVAVSNLTSMIEPFIIVFLGGLIGGIVLAMFLPILKIMQFVGK